MDTVGWLVVILNRATKEDANHVSTFLFRSHNEAIQFVKDYIYGIYVYDEEDDDEEEEDDISKIGREYIDNPKDELDIAAESFHIRSISYGV